MYWYRANNTFSCKYLTFICTLYIIRVHKQYICLLEYAEGVDVLQNQNAVSSCMRLLLSEFQIILFFLSFMFLFLQNCGIKPPKIWRKNYGDSSFNNNPPPPKFPSFEFVFQCYNLISIVRPNSFHTALHFRQLKSGSPFLICKQYGK